MKRLLWIAVTLLALALVGGAMASQFNLSALPEPGRTESVIATKAKHFLVRRASRASVAPASADTRASIEEGDNLFGTECSECHGNTGRNPTDAGRWMYPRAADPFGRVESDEHIWDLVHFVRTLPVNPNPKGETAHEDKTDSGP